MNWNKTKSVDVVVHRETMEKLCMWFVALILYTCVVPFSSYLTLSLLKRSMFLPPAIIITIPQGTSSWPGQLRNEHPSIHPS